MKMNIVRLEHNIDCTRGVILIDDEIICCSLELPDKGNERSISCIPNGVYSCEPFKSDIFGDVFIVNDVPGRGGILFHVGNTAKDTRGCILPGEKFGTLKGEKAVVYSKHALSKLRTVLKGKKHFALRVESV